MAAEDSYRPNKLLKGFYQEARRFDSVEEVSPSFSALSGVKERYTDFEHIGQGALKDVYKCFDQKSRRWVALAKQRLFLGKEFYDFFIHEAWLTASLNHPNIIKVYETNIDEDGVPYFTMDLKSNTTLAEVVKTKFSKRTYLLEVFIKICDAMAYAHSLGIIHLDLKPANIQCSSFGEVLVCDWGLGKVVKNNPALEEKVYHSLKLSHQQTLYGEIKGTPGYMAPEQFSPEAEKDYYSDVFSLGCLLHYILTSEAPFRGDFAEKKRKTLYGKREPLQETYHNLDIPKSLDAIAQKAISVDPEDRYHSVESLREDVYLYLSGYATTAENPRFAQKVHKLINRHKLLVAIIGISAAILTLVTFWSGNKIRSVETKADAISQEQDSLKKELVYINGEYEEFKTTVVESKVKLAKEMLTTAQRLNSIFYLSDSAANSKMIERLSKDALVLNPEMKRAHTTLFITYCARLNFKKALNYLPSEDTNNYLAQLSSIAQQFSHYDYDESRRPSVVEIQRLLQYISKKNYQLPISFANMMVYDTLTRGTTMDSDLLESYIAFINAKVEQMHFDYSSSNNGHLIITNEGALIKDHVLKVFTLLRFLDIHALELSNFEKINLYFLNGTSINTLNLSKSEFLLKENQSFTIHGLEKVLIKEGHVSEAYIRKTLKSDLIYEIVYVND
ncbi:MAG: serine/threonine-protein kinase [Akkermansiaceae bacterium]